MAGFQIDYNEMKEKGIYDYVCANYWKMSKEQLKDICKELSYAIHTSLENKLSKDDSMEREIEAVAIEALMEEDDN